jgi:hypothetical protein
MFSELSLMDLEQNAWFQKKRVIIRERDAWSSIFILIYFISFELVPLLQLVQLILVWTLWLTKCWVLNHHFLYGHLVNLVCKSKFGRADKNCVESMGLPLPKWIFKAASLVWCSRPGLSEPKRTLFMCKMGRTTEDALTCGQIRWKNELGMWILCCIIFKQLRPSHAWYRWSGSLAVFIHTLTCSDGRP